MHRNKNIHQLKLTNYYKHGIQIENIQNEIKNLLIINSIQVLYHRIHVQFYNSSFALLTTSFLLLVQKVTTVSQVYCALG